MYASPSFIGHSLWLVPREPAKSRIQDVIDRQSSEHETVKFGAHVTLIAGVKTDGGEGDIFSKAESLAADISPITGVIERAACKDLYFQSVFALLRRDQALIDAHNLARAAFGQEPDTDSTYMPHLSLIYGDLPMPSREAVQHEVEPNLMGLPVELDSIQVWCTEGVVSEWKLLRSFPLKDS